MEIEYDKIRNARRYRVDLIISWITKRIRKGLMQAMYYQHFLGDFSSKTRATIAFNKDYKTALQVIRKENDLDKKDRFNMAIVSREDIVREAREVGDLKLALLAEKDLASLEGLYSEDKEGAVQVIFNTAMPVAEDVDGPVGEDTLKEYKRLAGIEDDIEALDE